MSTPGSTNFFISSQGAIRIQIESKSSGVEINNSLIIGTPITIHQADPIRRVQEQQNRINGQAMGSRPEFFRPADRYEPSVAVLREEKKEIQIRRVDCCEKFLNIFRCGN